MEREQDVMKDAFTKETIADRFHLPMDRIDLLIVECGMPFADEDKFADWFAQEDNNKRFLAEMEQFGAIAQMKAKSPRPHPATFRNPQAT